MLFGLLPPVQFDPAQITGMHSLPQGGDGQPPVPTMNPEGTNAPPPAFVNGPGGARLTPEQLAERHRTAAQQIAAGMDFSPVQSWTQGAARVAQALVGTLEQKHLDKAAKANSAETDTIVKALLHGQQGVDPATYSASLLGAAANPYIDPSVRNLAESERERIIKANAPEYFMSGRDRVAYDPATKTSKVVYDGPTDAQEYADGLGLTPGTQEYKTAMTDFVLKGNGATAFEHKTAYEGVRQNNREATENLRQNNRLSLRATPTYADTHPRPHATGGGGGAAPSHAVTTMAGTMAPILGKVSRGEALTAAEQQAWNMYRPPSRGRRSVAGALVDAGGMPPSSGGPVQIKSKDEYARLPAGAAFIDPKGVHRVKGR